MNWSRATFFAVCAWGCFFAASQELDQRGLPAAHNWIVGTLFCVALGVTLQGRDSVSEWRKRRAVSGGSGS